MHIEINDKTTLRKIQDTFSNFYPYLRIEFYSRPHKKYEQSNEINQIEPNILIGDIKNAHVSGTLEILPLEKVSDLETELRRRFGLFVQVLKKEKNGWEQTTGMDDFTLAELNEFGRSSDDDFIIAASEEDFEEVEEKPEKLF